MTNEPIEPTHFAVLDYPDGKPPRAMIVIAEGDRDSCVAAIARHIALSTNRTRSRGRLLINTEAYPPTDEAGFNRMLDTDPIAAAIFKYGRDTGRADVEHERGRET